MKRLLAIGFVLTALPGLALAEPSKSKPTEQRSDQVTEPIKLTDAQMDGVTAGIQSNPDGVSTADMLLLQDQLQ